MIDPDKMPTYIGWFAAAMNCFILLAISIPVCLRNVRASRTLHSLREIICSYEKDLRERGVTLPPRCVWCCQVLPEHVDVCDFKHYYAELGHITKILTRPAIKYYPNGDRPPHLTGGSK